MNRFRFDEKSVAKLKAHLKSPSKPVPRALKRFKGEVRKGKLYLDGKEVVPREKVDTYLRKLILDGETPMTRDAAYYWIQKNTAGIARAAIDDFLKKQRIVRETDNQQPTTKRQKRRIKQKGTLHVDLVEIKFKDLPFDPKVTPNKRLYATLTDEEKAEGDELGDITKGYFFGCVDSLTSLAWYKFAGFKSYKYITPLAKEAFQWFSKQLDRPINKMVVKSDQGAEFDWNKWKTWGIRPIIVKHDAYIEAKNSHFQRALYRVAKTYKTRDLRKLTQLAVTQINKTQSSITKKAPIENAREPTSKLSKRYNKKRGPGTGGEARSRPLVVGKDRVRVQLMYAKDKGIGYKAYKGKTWSKRAYKVTTKLPGGRYKVNRKVYHRDALRLTDAYDPASEKVIKRREREN